VVAEGLVLARLQERFELVGVVGEMGLDLVLDLVGAD
jgi:hypothetical protein